MKRTTETTFAPPDSPAEREPDNVTAMEGEPVKSEASPTPPPPAPPNDRAARQNLSMIEYVVARQAQESEAGLWLKCIAEINWERLQFAWWFEKERVKMPLEVTNNIINTMIKAAEAAIRAELAASARHKQLGPRTRENFDPIKIDGVVVNPPVAEGDDSPPPINPHLPPELQELQRGIRNLTVQDRMMLGTALDQMVNIMRLKLKLKKEQEAKEAAQNPSEEEKSG